MTAFSTEGSRQALKTVLDPALKDATDTVNNPKTSAPGVMYGVTNEKETVYLGSSGVREYGKPEKVDNDTEFSLYSTNKAITALAVLQLIEQGKVELDAPVKKYAPNIADVKLATWNEAGEVELTTPKTDVTVRHLLTHTSGLSFTFFSKRYEKLYADQNVDTMDPKTNLLEWSYFLAEPGTEYHYGLNMEWAGHLVELVTGVSLGTYFKEHIFGPAGITKTSYHPADTENFLRLHARSPEGVITCLPPQFQPSRDVIFEWGGHGLVGPVDDYLQFMRIWLNKGKADNGVQILGEKTWALAVSNQLPIGTPTRYLPSLRHDLVFDIDNNSQAEKIDTWGLGFSRNEAETATGRAAGSLHWLGIANAYYFIDLENNIAAFYASQILPGGSKEHCDILETAVYKTLKESK